MASHRREKPKPISVRIQPTIGPPFTLSLPASTMIPNLKESISDKMGLSPQKMTLLLHSSELQAGTLRDNRIEDGTEIRLVPAVESGVMAANSVDPVAMMKHSMSGISDQQIDDFLNGKSPLSVAIRVGESVVVVNLHRAKVEEIEVEPPPPKRRCYRPRRLSEDDDFSDYAFLPSHSEGARYLNSNSSLSEDRDRELFEPSPVYDRSSTLDDLPSSSSSKHTAAHKDEPCHSRTESVSLSMQTDSESKKEIKLPENGISMKRKAVMEAISEILRKMYASSEKGRLPGSFKGRFSSEFTCDSDMKEILHSKTTMTSYGTDLDEDKKNSGDVERGESLDDDTTLSKAKVEENEELRDKVARLKSKMQQLRAMKIAKRNGERSPCGWMEARNYDVPIEPPKVQDQTGFCGLKRGFLVAD